MIPLTTIERIEKHLKAINFRVITDSEGKMQFRYTLPKKKRTLKKRKKK